MNCRSERREFHGCEDTTNFTRTLWFCGHRLGGEFGWSGRGWGFQWSIHLWQVGVSCDSFIKGLLSHNKQFLFALPLHSSTARWARSPEFTTECVLPKFHRNQGDSPLSEHILRRKENTCMGIYPERNYRT